MWEEIKDLYTYAMEYGADPRVKDYFLMSSPVPTLGIVIVYLILVTKIGPALMKNRAPYDLKYVLITYNASQVVLSSFLFFVNVYASVLGGYSIFQCQNVNFSPTDLEGILGVYGSYFYFLTKIIELLDTFFFVLRKKQSQITFLHLFHHAQLPIFTWIITKFMPGGSPTMGMAENSLVHVIMYSYYLLAGLGPHMQKYLWWKKYITSIQLIQFIMALLHMTLIIFFNDNCKTLYRPFVIVGAIYIIALYFLFKEFYDNTYTQENDSKRNSFKG